MDFCEPSQKIVLMMGGASPAALGRCSQHGVLFSGGHLADVAWTPLSTSLRIVGERSGTKGHLFVEKCEAERLCLETEVGARPVTVGAVASTNRKVTPKDIAE